MADLYHRILLWHKLLAMQTGGLALCSAKHRLNRSEAAMWSHNCRNVADDIDQFLHDGTFILDDRGARMVDCGIGSTPEGVKTGTGGPSHVATQSKSHADLNKATGRKAGGLRVATRKTK